MKKAAAMLLILMSCFSFLCPQVYSAQANPGDTAPSFSAVDVDGNKKDFSEYLSKNAPIMLVFFATWCPPCRKEVPELVKIKKKYASQGLEMLAVSVDSSRKVLPRFIEKRGINYDVWQGGEGARIYNVVGIPTNILIDKNGKIAYRSHRPPSGKEIEKVL